MNHREPFYAPIGNIVVAFQDADFILTMLLASLLNDDASVALSFAVPLSFRRKLDVVKSIAPFKINDPGLLGKLNDVVKQLHNAEEERNTIVHGHWLNPVKEGPIGFIKPVVSRNGLKNFLESKSIADMEKVIGTIRKAEQDLRDFLSELHKRGIIQAKEFPITDKT